MRTTRGLPSATTIWVYSTLLALGYLAGQPTDPVAPPALVVQADAQSILTMRPIDGTPLASNANTR